MKSGWHYYPIHELSDLIRTQKVSPVDVVAQCLERIERLQPSVNAFITVLGDQAVAEARQAEADIKAGMWRGPLHGVPVALKDMYDTAGVKTTAAFEHFADRVPAKDAHAVVKLKEAGAIIIGKTNMHRLAMGTTSLDSSYGAVHNPWNAAYIAGGSSGGSAAAVAAGLCYATIDTDAIGSCRLPAACCGVVGYKCTWGLIDNSGILEGQPADTVILMLATAGIITRDVKDTATVAGILTGNGMAVERKGEPARIGVVTNFGADDETRSSFSEAVAVFKKLGYALTEVAAPFDQQDMDQIEAARKAADADAFSGIDLMILPTLAGTVPEAANVGHDPRALPAQNTFFANYLGLPAVSVPCGVDERGLPMGLQVVGPRGEDERVLQTALAYQDATGWHGRHPA